MPKKYEPNEADRKKLRALVIAGFAVDKAAEIIGVCKAILYRHYKKDIQSAATDATAEVANNLFRMTKKNPAAAIFWMKTRAGWREKEQQVERRPYTIVLESDEMPKRLRIIESNEGTGTNGSD